MTDPNPLSPAAQAVLDAVTLKRWDVPHQACPKSIDQIKSDVAAAMQAAAANQNTEIDVPFDKIIEWEKIQGVSMSYWTAAQWGYKKALDDLTSIAAELEGAQ